MAKENAQFSLKKMKLSHDTPSDVDRSKGKASIVSQVTEPDIIL